MSPIKEQNKTLSKDSNQKAVFTPLGASNHSTSEREPHDYYATDPKAAELLLAVEDFSQVIWEPACGEGHLSKVFEQAGHTVISTDLIYRGYGSKWLRHLLLGTDTSANNSGKPHKNYRLYMETSHNY